MFERRETSSLFAMVREQTKMSCHDVQAQVIAHGLSSESAIVFFDALPTIDVLMPPLAMTAIEEIPHGSCSQRTATGSPCAWSSTQARLGEATLVYAAGASSTASIGQRRCRR